MEAPSFSKEQNLYMKEIHRKQKKKKKEKKITLDRESFFFFFHGRVLQDLTWISHSTKIQTLSLCNKPPLEREREIHDDVWSYAA